MWGLGIDELCVFFKKIMSYVNAFRGTGTGVHNASQEGLLLGGES